MDIGKELAARLEEFADDLESGKPIEATRVRREETPDGPLHTFEKVKIVLHDERQ